MSVFTFASAIARVLAGLDTTTRPARLANSVAIAQVFPVASNATSSAGPSPSANARTPSGVVANLPACDHQPALPDRDLRELPVHIQPDAPPLAALSASPSPFSSLTITTMIGSGWAKRHLRIRAHSATGQVAGAATY